MVNGPGLVTVLIEPERAGIFFVFRDLAAPNCVSESAGDSTCRKITLERAAFNLNQAARYNSFGVASLFAKNRFPLFGAML